MAAIWAEVLRVTQVGIHDNFFDLGGHSLAAVQVFSLIRERFRRNLRIGDFFNRPTIAGLAELVDGSETGDPIETPLPRDRDRASRRAASFGTLARLLDLITSQLKGAYHHVLLLTRRGRGA